MDTTVASFITGLALGEPMQVDGFCVFPLFHQQKSTLDYIALQHAIESRLLTADEVSMWGSVGDLKVQNIADQMVLGIDGEELIGAKQNRILNMTVLLAAKQETTIPVSCTEQGRWSYTTRSFAPSDSFAPPRIRGEAKSTVTASLRAKQGFRADQGRVWDGVSRLAEEKGVWSPSSAMKDVLSSSLADYDRMLKDLPHRDGQHGLLVVYNGKALGCYVISRADVYAGLHKRLLRSYMVEITPGVSTECSNAADLASEFLKSTLATHEERFKSIGAGEDLRYSSHELVGSALVHDHHVAHLAFFRQSGTRDSYPGPALRSFRTRRRFRQTAPRPEETNSID